MARVLMTTIPITSIQEKGDRDIVTNVDVAIEDAIGSFLAQRTPSIGFLGEEGSVRPPHSIKWVLDPIDGTGNFVHGLPLYGTAISLIDRGRTTLAVIDLPLLEDTYTAFSRSSARQNGREIKCGEVTELDKAMIGLSEFARGEGANETNQQMLRVSDALSREAQHVRMIGSAITTLAWVADGRLDAAIIFSNQTWDTSAGVLVAQCAGARTWDLHGRPHTINSHSVVVTSPGIEANLMALLRRTVNS
jgi:myo-inositol-1(or 4)-monophosphatase